MNEHPETVRVVSDNPAHEQGYVVKNRKDLTENDVLFGEKTVKVKATASSESDADEFDSMDAEALRAYLTEHGETPHHATGEAKLRKACRALAAGLV